MTFLWPWLWSQDLEKLWVDLTLVSNICMLFCQNPLTCLGVIAAMNIYTWPWSDLDLEPYDFDDRNMSSMHHLPLHTQIWCDPSIRSEDGVPNFCTSDFVATFILTLISGPSKINQFISLSLTLNTPLTKVCWNSAHWFVKYRTNRKHFRTTNGRTHSLTDGQPQNNAPNTPIGGEGMKSVSVSHFRCHSVCRWC